MCFNIESDDTHNPQRYSMHAITLNIRRFLIEHAYLCMYNHATVEGFHKMQEYNFSIATKSLYMQSALICPHLYPITSGRGCTSLFQLESIAIIGENNLVRYLSHCYCMCTRVQPIYTIYTITPLKTTR